MKKIVIKMFFLGLMLLGGNQVMAMQIMSSAFSDGENIPTQYTCEGSDISPPLSWQGIPAGAKTLVLIVDDPDAPMGTWDHWVVFNIPPSTTQIAADGKFPAETKDGKNSWGKAGWGGPCPPSGTHHYQFKLYALDIVLTLANNTSKATIEKAMRGHVLAETKIVGLYKKKISN